MKPWEFTRVAYFERSTKNPTSLLRLSAERQKIHNGHRCKSDEISMRKYAELGGALWLDSKINQFYNSHPSHINETIKGTSVVYFMCAIDEWAIKKKFKKDPRMAACLDGDDQTAFDALIQKNPDLGEIMVSHFHSVKIGTTQGAPQRIKTIQTGCPLKLGYMYWFRGGFEEEKRLHKLFASDHIFGEWFAWGEQLEDYLQTMDEHSKAYSYARNEESLFKLIKQEAEVA